MGPFLIEIGSLYTNPDCDDECISDDFDLGLHLAHRRPNLEVLLIFKVGNGWMSLSTLVALGFSLVLSKISTHLSAWVNVLRAWRY